MKDKLVIIFVLLSFIGQAQSQKSFDKLIEQTNRFLSVHSQLQPYDEYFILKSLELNKREIKEIMNEGSNVDAHFSSINDTIQSSDLLFYLNDVIIENLDRILAHDKFSYDRIQKLRTDDFNFTMLISSDRKLFNFSLQEKHGGTYSSRMTRSLYLNIEKDSISNKRIEKKYYPSFSSDGLDHIYSIETTEGIKYILTEFVRGCSYCFESSVSLVKFKNEKFIKDFSYTVNSRHWDSSVEYDYENKLITVDYRIDDLNPICNCELTVDYDGESEIEYEQCHCIYHFNGTTFELVKDTID